MIDSDTFSKLNKILHDFQMVLFDLEIILEDDLKKEKI